MKTIAERMREVQEQGNLTVSDMAVWFGVTRASMSTWLIGGRCPLAAKTKQLEPLLGMLDRVVSSDLGIFPVPLDVRQYERKAYIERVKRHAANTVPTARATPRGRQVLGVDQK